jgi:hypothetical protein
MDKLFFSMIFIVMNYTLTLGNVRVEIVPHFIGYIGLAVGLGEMARHSSGFLRLRPWAIGMAVFTAVIFALQIAGFTEQWAVISLTAALVISSAIGFFILYRVITGIRQLETDFEAAWESERLLMAWKIMLAANAVGYALVLIAYLMLTGASPSDGAGLLITVGSLIAFAAGIYFLVRFYKTRQLYGLPDVYMY